MKFKTIFILFNAVIIVSFLIIYFMPLFMLGWEYTSVFWSKNWYLPVIFIAVIGSLNTYFIINWKLFRYLETEDWDKLKSYLEKQIFENKRVRPQYIRVLVNAYLVKSEMESIKKLDTHLKSAHPKIRMAYPMLLSIPYVLSNDSAAMKTHFKEFLGELSGRDLDWVKWGYAFASFLGEEKDNAKYMLLEITSQRKDKILNLLTAYILDAFRNLDQQVVPVVDTIIKELRTDYTRATWEREIEKAKNEIFIVILTRIIIEATEWLFKQQVETEA